MNSKIFIKEKINLEEIFAANTSENYTDTQKEECFKLIISICKQVSIATSTLMLLGDCRDDDAPPCTQVSYFVDGDFTFISIKEIEL